MAHMSGSMGHYSGGYGTIKIYLRDTGPLIQGTEYSYIIPDGGAVNTPHTATADRIDGEVVLVDSNFTLGENPPPFQTGRPLKVLIPGMGNAPLLDTIITNIESLNPPESNTDTGSAKTMKLYDGSNVRKFIGMETIPINEFVTTILKDVPVVQIDKLGANGITVAQYKTVQTEKNQKGKKGNKKKNKKKKFNIFKGAREAAASMKRYNNVSLTEIEGDVEYNIMVDAPPKKLVVGVGKGKNKNKLRGGKKKKRSFNLKSKSGKAIATTKSTPLTTTARFWEISYVSVTPPPPVPMYTEPPMDPIPASFPPSYQNSSNEGVEELLTGRKCGNCTFFEAESGNCSRWNAIARDYYWCASWDTMEPVIAQSNIYTQYIDESTSEGDDLYNYFSVVVDPQTQEPNLSNFLTAFDPLHSVYKAYLYGDSLRRMLDSQNAFDFDNTPLDLFFTTQEHFLEAIDFINDGGLVEFEIPDDQYDSVQQHICTYSLVKKSSSSLSNQFPQTVTLSLHGSFFGEPKNILSQLDFTNAKIAINPKAIENTKHILIDNRYSETEINGIVHVDILRDSIRERILKFFNDNSTVYKLDGVSCFKFIQWIADRSFNTETMQFLYQYLLTLEEITSENMGLMTLIENSLGEELIDDPVTIQLPMSGFGGEE